MSAICARLSKGKGVIHKRVENRRLSTLLCPRLVGGAPARRQRTFPAYKAEPYQNKKQDI